MKDFAEKNKTALGVVCAIMFFVSYGMCAFFGWKDVVNTLFSTANLGQPFKMPLTYSIMSFLFFVIFCLIVVFGFVLKNKIMTFFGLFYVILFILSFIMLGVFATGNIASEGLYSLLTYLLTFTLLPVYGVIWNIGVFFFLIFVPLIILNIVAVVKIVKQPKLKK